jgi:hypothetical protein
VIFSLFAKSNARSNGILSIGQLYDVLPHYLQRSPDAFQMHRPNFDHMSHFFTLENAVSSPSSHAGHIQQFRAIDHVIVCNSQSVRFKSKRNNAVIPSLLATQTPFAST